MIRVIQQVRSRSVRYVGFVLGTRSLYVFRLTMETGGEALSLETVIIVACICGSIVLALTVVLIVLCCRRRRTKCKCRLLYTSDRS